MTCEELREKISKRFSHLKNVTVDDKKGEGKVFIRANVDHEDQCEPHAYATIYTWLDLEAPVGLQYVVELFRFGRL